MFAGLGIGIFRYRLYDIDRLLNRTLVYGLLTASLAAAYAAGVLVLGGMASGGRGSSSSWPPSPWPWSTTPSSRPRRRSGCARPAGRPGDARS
jgi:hypothetical protein